MPVDKWIQDAQEVSRQAYNDAQGSEVFQNAKADVSRVQESFDQQLSDISAKQSEMDSAFISEIDNIKSEYSSLKLDSNEMIGNLKSVYEKNIGAVANSYNTQISREAERVDALVAGGSLGGNAYRAYQARTTSSRELTSAASAQIADLSIKAQESMVSAGVSIAAQNNNLFANMSQTVAQLTTARAQSSFNYSQLLVSTQAQAEASIQNLYSIQLQAIDSSRNLILQNRKMDVDMEIAEMQSEDNNRNFMLQNRRMDMDMEIAEMQSEDNNRNFMLQNRRMDMDMKIAKMQDATSRYNTYMNNTNSYLDHWSQWRTDSSGNKVATYTRR